MSLDSELVPYYFTGLIILAILILLVVIASRREKMRVEFLQALAVRLGLQSHDKDRSVLPKGLRNIPLFLTGKKRKITNVMHGAREGVMESVFDFQCRIGSKKMAVELTQTVACFEKEGLNLPPFSMRPSAVMHDIPPALDFVEIDFDSTHPQFAKGYVIKSSDQGRTRALFNEDVINYYTRIRGIAIEGAGSILVFYRPGQQRRPEDLYAFRDNGLKVLTQFEEAAQRIPALPPADVATSSVEAGSVLPGENDAQSGQARVEG